MTHNDAAAVHVAVQSVAPFEEYVESLQPRFTLTPEAAYAAAIPTSQLMELQEIRALLADLSLALPSSARTSTATTEIADGQEKRSRTDVSKSGPADTAPPTPGAAPAQAVEPFDLTGEAVTVEPSLRYRSAVALLQEVALLSTYVKDAAVKSGTIPYIVRLLITVMPTARRTPYDVYTNVSFFGANEEPVVYGRGDARAFGVADIVSSGLPEAETTRRLGTRSHEARLAADGFARLRERTRLDNSLACEGRPLDVIPLFVTDSVESSLVSAGRQQVRSVGGSVGGLLANVGVGAAARSHASAGARTLSHDVSGIYTLGRTAPNTLQVRLSAAFVDGTFHTMARTFNLTALVLIPAGIVPDDARVALQGADEFLSCRSAVFTSRSVLRDADSGVELPSGTWATLRTRVAAETGIPEAGIADPLLAAVTRGDYTAFRLLFEQAAGRDITARDAQMVWPDLVGAAGMIKASSGTFDIPFGRFGFFNSASEEVRPLFDDGKTARLSLVGAQGLSAKGTLTGHLKVRAGDAVTMLPTIATKVSDDGTSAELAFPSLSLLPAGAVVREVNVEYRTPTPRWSSARLPWLWTQDTTPVVRTSPPEAPKAGFAIQPRSSLVRADAAGKGQLVFAVLAEDAAVARVHATVDGAVVAGIRPEVSTDAPALVLPANRTYVLSLAGLVPGSTLRLSSWRQEDKKKVLAPTVEFTVVSGGSSVDDRDARLPPSR